MSEKIKILFPYYTLESRGQGMLGIATCMICGAAVIVDDAEAHKLHNDWHKDQAPGAKDE